MLDRSEPSNTHQKALKRLAVGAAIATALLAANIAITTSNVRKVRTDVDWVTHTQNTVDSLDGLLSLAKDAETGQRGFIITGRTEYLEPYSDAVTQIEREVVKVSKLMQDEPQQQARLRELKTSLANKLSELDETIELRQSQGFAAAQTVVLSDRGRQEMDNIRTIVEEMVAAERLQLSDRLQQSNRTYRTAIFTGLFSGVAALSSLVALIWLARQYLNARSKAAATIAAQAEKLRKERRSLELALAAANLGRWELKLGDLSAKRNLRHDQIFGYDSLRSQWTYEVFLSHVVPADRPLVEEKFAQAIANKESWDFGCRIRRVDGAHRWIWAKGKVVQNKRGQAERIVGIVSDITERRQTEEAMRQARSRLSSTLAASEIGTWELNLIDQTVQADANTARIFNVTPEEAKGGSVEAYIRVVHPADRERVRSQIEQSPNAGEAYEVAYRIVNASGETRWLNARGRIEQDETGRAVRMPGVVIDVTKQRQIEEKLRASERQFQQIADTMPQIVWVARSDGYLEYYNRRWYEYSGAAPEECVGAGWGGWLNPDDQQIAAERWSHSLETGEPYEVEFRIRSKDEEYRWFLGRALPVRDENDQIVKWFGTCTDIEDFKQAQEDRNNFVRLADNTTDFVGMFDMGGRLFYVNAAGRNRVGIDSIEAARQVSIDDLFFPEDRSRIFNEFLPAVRSRGSGTTEIRIRHLKTSEAIWMTYSATVLTNASGQPTGLATISQDITELRQFARNLADADRYKDEFLATLAHELRNPLAPIRNGLKIMKLAPDNAAAVERVRAMMDRQLSQMVRLVDDLLDVSRISRGKIELAKERVELAAILEQAVETSRPAIEAAEHTLRVIVPAEPIYLEADAVRLTQVFSNLLNNASKYSESKGEISIQAEAQTQEVVVSVKDNGIGIASDVLPEIFGMFKQVNSALEKSQGGLGIGLTLVEKLVKMHGGSVSAFSEGEGKGSEFVVRLPVMASFPLPTTTASREAIAAEPRRVLVVDDNEDSALSLSMLFEIRGDEVRTAHDGRSAVASADAFRPDIVLLDIGLPEISGYEAAKQIRAQSWGQEMVLVALTGWGQPEDRRQSCEAGFNAHQVKPINHDTLLQLLAELTPESSQF